MSDSLPLKRAKMKIKTRQPSYDEDSSGDLIIDDVPTTSFAAKKSIMLLKPTVSNNSSASSSSSSTINSNSNNLKKKKKRDSATSSDEERWLTAIETGKLEDVDDELKKIKPKDPALMTARQRAMYDRTSEGQQHITATPTTLMSLPTGYKEKVLTAEAIQKAAIKSQKRKQLADEKREKDKKKTMERLLKKQESKTKGFRPKAIKSNCPTALYIQCLDKTTISFPKSVNYPLKRQVIKSPPAPKLCSMKCGNLRKYSCSQTGAALCSLACYRKNIASRIL